MVKKTSKVDNINEEIQLAQKVLPKTGAYAKIQGKLGYLANTTTTTGGSGSITSSLNNNSNGSDNDNLYDEMEDFTAYICELPCKLGRPLGEKKNKEKKGFITLGNELKVSRHHATIAFDKKKDTYTIQCHSKNGMVVDKISYSNGDIAELKDGSSFKLATCYLYFLTGMEGEEA